MAGWTQMLSEARRDQDADPGIEWTIPELKPRGKSRRDWPLYAAMVAFIVFAVIVVIIFNT